MNYTVFIDHDMTNKGLRERVTAEDGGNILAGEEVIFRSLPFLQCPKNPYTVKVVVNIRYY